MQDQEALIGRILARDERAFRQLVADHEKLVKHIVFRIVTNDADREDLAQEVFVKVYEKLGEFRSECKLSSWIARIAYNTALNWVDKKKVPLYEDMAPEGATVDSFAAETGAPDDVSAQRDISRRLNEEIDRLPVQYGIVVTLYHLCEMQYEEIAVILSQPVGTVKSHLFRARKILKERLLARYQPEELWQTGT